MSRRRMALAGHCLARPTGRLSTSDLPGFTVSYGLVAAGRCGSLEEAIRRADGALYEAKASGRDRITIAGRTPETRRP